MTLVVPALAAAGDDAAALEFFESKIRPVLVEHCYKCHSVGAKALKGGLRLDTRAGIREGGDSGPAVAPGDPDSSLVLEALRFEGLEMPPSGRLPGRVVADFEAWVKAGAPDPRDGGPSSTPPAPSERIDFDRARQSWQFQTPTRLTAPPPPVGNAAWVRGPIDAFVLARLQQAGLEPSPEANRRTLCRRVTLDLTGLPPRPEDVDTFVAEPGPDAYERLVERLLASPHYGERWARMWLDVARYAEDQAHIVGKNRSLFYPNAYLYRDWVIGALNRDLPYDRFITLQLAADLVTPAEPRDLAALGFLGLGPKYYRRDAPEVMADEWEDRVDVVSRGLLGLTVACARCHDHKFDPIAAADYYALAGVFASTEMFNRPLDNTRRKGSTGQAVRPEDALHVVRDGAATDLNVLVRGDVHQKGERVRRRFLSILCPEGPKPFTTGSGRRELAEAIADPANPLTARVLVNRVWALDFGRPLVGSPSNFGRLGDPPSHPELLDDLAARFMDSGWSLKWLQREIVLSSTYRQESSVNSEANTDSKTKTKTKTRTGLGAQTIDPTNRLLWRMNRRRLEVESWRDSILAASGRLDQRVGGASIDLQDPASGRRTIYSRISRLELDSTLAAFDFPDPNAHSERRVPTTTPLQKLFVLNSPFMVAQADSLVERLALEAGPDDAARIRRAYLVVFGRPALDHEVRIGLDFLGDPEERPQNWPAYAQVLLACNELLFVD